MIKLTTGRTTTNIYISPAYIISMFRLGSKTCITLAHDREILKVSETPEQVLELIRQPLG